MKRITVCLLAALFLSGSVRADRFMESGETESLVRHLTDAPRLSWIRQGMIRARHLEYYQYDNSLREATETVYRDGSRFRLEVHLENGISTDNLSNQIVARQFQQDLRLNRDCTYAWDGQKYTRYYQSAEYAYVMTNALQPPAELSGPAVAGMIPWGHGDFTFLVLMSQNPTGRVFREDDRDKIRLQYVSDTISPETEIAFVLDPARDYAVLSYSIENEQALLRQTYEEYEQAGNCWIPSKVLIERFDKRSGTPALISYEDWQFEIIDPAVPAEELFTVRFKNGTTVELQAGDDLNTFMYNASDQVDIAKLLEDKIMLLQAPDPEAVNCATAVVQHVAKGFAIDIQPQTLADLVEADSKQTALSAMKQTFEDAGLTCMAIETDLETLQTIPGCVKVLYLGLSRHYVVLDHIDQDGIWLIDLTNRKFYVRQNVDEFLQEWNSKVALLVSDEPITPPLNANFRYLEAGEMAGLYGGGDFGTYSCTDLIQPNYHILCQQPIGGFLCHGGYYIFYERWGCIEDEDGGVCVGQKMPSYDLYHCLNDPFTYGNCVLPDAHVTRYIRACR